MSTKENDLFTKMGSPKFVLAPMVDASELAWRMLGRRYGVQLTFSPMIHAEMFVRDKSYRKANSQFSTEDRPFIVQFCANNPETFLKAAEIVQPYCDAVDLNLGCPQGIAKRGHYGAYLQDEWTLISEIVRLAAQSLDVPVSCKIRIFQDVDRTISYAKMLESAGASLLTVHGRTREMKGQFTGLADWDQIKRVKSAVNIPVIANGNIQYFDDVTRCLDTTGADAVMSAEGHLHNPALFAGLQPSVYAMGLEYLEFASRFPCPMSVVRGHLFKLCRHAMCEHPEFRKHIGEGRTVERFREVLEEMQRLCSSCRGNQDSALPHPHWICQPYERPKPPPQQETGTVANGACTDKPELTAFKRLVEEERQARRLAKQAKRARKEALPVMYGESIGDLSSITPNPPVNANPSQSEPQCTELKAP